VYTPDGDGPFPALVYLHGGEWTLGTLETYDSTCRALANDGECVVVSVDYRLAPEHPFPAAVHDAVAAAKWVAANSVEVGGDGRIAVAGDSAGGTLAAVVSLAARDFDGPKIDYQLLIYPATSAERDWPSYEENGTGYYLETADVEYYRRQYFADSLHAYNRYAFPMEARDLSGLPPATVVTCEFDPLRDEGDAYAERLASAGVPVVHRRYEGLIHGVASMLGEPGVPKGRAVLADLGADVREAFGSG
jgi:acetyl esterase